MDKITLSAKQIKIIKNGIQKDYPNWLIAEEAGVDKKDVPAILKQIGYKPPVNRTKTYFTPKEDERLLKMHAEGVPSAKIAAKMNKAVSSVMGRLYYFRDKEKKEQEQQAAKLAGGDNIWNLAGLELLLAGHTDMQIKVMSLDERMRKANFYRFQKGKDQLGRKPEWLHG